MRAAMLLALACAGCVSFPIPPTDMGNMEAGQLGRVRLQLSAKWEPNWQGVMRAVVNRPLPAPKSLAK